MNVVQYGKVGMSKRIIRVQMAIADGLPPH